MQRLNQLVSKLGLGLAALLFATVLAFSAPQQAQAGEFELGGGFGYAGLVGKHDNDYHGFTFTIMAGYHMLDWLSLDIEQDLGGIFYEHNNDLNGFYGATMFEGRFIYRLSNVELFAKLGIGAVYVNTDWDDHNDRHSAWDNAWFGLRLGIGATYMVASNWGIGLNFDYTPSFDDDVVTHFLRLQLHLLFRF